LEWKVEVHRSAGKALRKLPRNLAERLLVGVEGLRTTPLPVGAEPLKGLTNTYRVRVGDYRIVYVLDRESSRILVTHIGHRKHVYRNL
jgi:mRNA interferase RelE/StbE